MLYNINLIIPEKLITGLCFPFSNLINQINQEIQVLDLGDTFEEIRVSFVYRSLFYKLDETIWKKINENNPTIRPNRASKRIIASIILSEITFFYDKKLVEDGVIHNGKPLKLISAIYPDILYIKEKNVFENHSFTTKKEVLHINYIDFLSSEKEVAYAIIEYLIFINQTIMTKKLKKSDNFEVDKLNNFLKNFKNKINDSFLAGINKKK